MLLNSLTALKPLTFNGNSGKHTNEKLGLKSLYFQPEAFRKDSNKQASGVPGRYLKVLA